MKNLLLLLLTYLLSFSAHSQVTDAVTVVGELFGAAGPKIVHDPVSEAQTASILVQTKESVTQAKKQLDLLKEAKDAISKVNDNLRQISYMQDIIILEQRLFEMSQETLDAANDMGISRHQRVIEAIQGYNTLSAATASTLEILNNILRDDFLDMDTAERLKWLREQKREVLDQIATARELNRMVVEVGTLAMLNRTYNIIERKNRKIIGKD